MSALPFSNKPGDMVYLSILLNYKFKFVKILKVNKPTFSMYTESMQESLEARTEHLIPWNLSYRLLDESSEKWNTRALSVLNHEVISPASIFVFLWLKKILCTTKYLSSNSILSLIRWKHELYFSSQFYSSDSNSVQTFF